MSAASGATIGAEMKDDLSEEGRLEILCPLQALEHQSGFPDVEVERSAAGH